MNKKRPLQLAGIVNAIAVRLTYDQQPRDWISIREYCEQITANDNHNALECWVLDMLADLVNEHLNKR